MTQIISKQEAQEQKLRYYFTGIPCKVGHTSTRYVNGGACVQCQLERRKIKYEENPEHAKEWQRAYRANNAELVQHQARLRYASDPEKARDIARKSWQANHDRATAYNRQYVKATANERRAYMKQYRNNNPHYTAKSRLARKNKIKFATVGWSERAEIDLLYKKRDELNQRFNLQNEHTLAVDHIIPLDSKTVCGLHVLANLQLLAKTINSSKKNKYQTDW